MASTTDVQASVDSLLRFQNLEGGWPYKRGESSWVEATALAVLALRSLQDQNLATPIKLGLGSLIGWQRSSGGWSPQPSVGECTAVTGLAALAFLNCSDEIPEERSKASLSWIDRQVYRDEFSFSLLLARALHQPPPHAPGSVPWYPGTAGWVSPTSLALLALRFGGQKFRSAAWLDLAASCSSYLLSRRCKDGGWNHGGSSLRSENAVSYPETTGLALLALRAAKSQPPSEAVQLARSFMRDPESMEGLAFLRIALSHETEALSDPVNFPAMRTSRDISLYILSASAMQGRNVFLWQG